MIDRIKASKELIVTCLVAGTVLAILAPYGTGTFSIPTRFMFWVGLCFAGGIGAGLSDVILKKMGRTVGRWPRALLQSVGGTVIVTALLLGLNLIHTGSVSPKQILVLIFFVWVISISISVIGALTDGKRIAENDAVSRAKLFERLPMHLKSAEIYALAAEDHYVRVITSNGDEMILMRLSDAIKEVTVLNGLSPHRSWWVAQAGVEKLTKSNGKSEIKLKSGQTVPVSRNGAKNVREAGWH